MWSKKIYSIFVIPIYKHNLQCHFCQLWYPQSSAGSRHLAGLQYPGKVKTSIITQKNQTNRKYPETILTSLILYFVFFLNLKWLLKAVVELFWNPVSRTVKYPYLINCLVTRRIRIGVKLHFWWNGLETQSFLLKINKDTIYQSIMEVY